MLGLGRIDLDHHYSLQILAPRLDLVRYFISKKLDLNYQTKGRTMLFSALYCYDGSSNARELV